MSGSKKEIVLSKNSMQLTFNIKIPTAKGMLFGVKISKSTELGLALVENKVSMTADEAHQKLGHVSQKSVVAISKYLGWKIKGTATQCEACAVGKARQRNVEKRSKHIIAKEAGERIFLDIASIKENNEFFEVEDGKPTSKPYWRILVDERTQLKFSDFFCSKKEMIEPTCELLNKWRLSGKTVKYIRCDNAGENLSLQSRMGSTDWKFGTEFEFTGRATPQRNHLAELGFAILANRGRAILKAANVPMELRKILWREAFMTATVLDGLTIINIDDIVQSRIEHWGLKLPEFAKYLKNWGEAGTVKIKTHTTPKIYDRGITCMMVGYAKQHAGDTYRMWDPNTKRVHVTRDVIWLNKMFFKEKSTIYFNPEATLEIFEKKRIVDEDDEQERKGKRDRG